MPIAEVKEKPPRVLSRQMIMVYGDPKAGKTTVAAAFPEVCFLATERGLDHVVCDRWDNGAGRYVIQSWEELLAATAEILAAKKHKTIAIDTIGNAALLCDQFVCAKHGEEYKADGKLGYGKGTTLIINELRRYLTKLSALGVGCVMIAHGERKTESRRTGPVEKAVPFIPGDNKKGELLTAVVGMCDLTLFCDQEGGGQRVFRTKPHSTYIAGDRTGALPDPLPMTYAALAAAFNNTPA